MPLHWLCPCSQAFLSAAAPPAPVASLLRLPCPFLIVPQGVLSVQGPMSCCRHSSGPPSPPGRKLHPHGSNFRFSLSFNRLWALWSWKPSCAPHRLLSHTYLSQFQSSPCLVFCYLTPTHIHTHTHTHTHTQERPFSPLPDSLNCILPSRPQSLCMHSEFCSELLCHISLYPFFLALNQQYILNLFI